MPVDPTSLIQPVPFSELDPPWEQRNPDVPARSREFVVTTHDMERPLGRRVLTPAAARETLRKLFREYGTGPWSVEVPLGAWDTLESCRTALGQPAMIEIQQEAQRLTKA